MMIPVFLWKIDSAHPSFLFILSLDFQPGCFLSPHKNHKENNEKRIERQSKTNKIVMSWLKFKDLIKFDYF